MSPVWVLLAVLAFQGVSVLSFDVDAQAQINNLMNMYKRQTDSLKRTLQNTLNNGFELPNLSNLSGMMDNLYNLQDNIDAIQTSLKSLQALSQPLKAANSMVTKGQGFTSMMSVF